MASPCPRCGDTRAEPLRRSVFYPLFKRLGYRLCECGRCRRKRIFPRHQKHGHQDAQQSEPEAQARAAGAAVGTVAADGDVPDASATLTAPKMERQTPVNGHRPDAGREPRAKAVCPFCHSQNCRPSRRKFWERWLGKPKMLRCRQCRRRFPRPTEH